MSAWRTCIRRSGLDEPRPVGEPVTRLFGTAAGRTAVAKTVGGGEETRSEKEARSEMGPVVDPVSGARFVGTSTHSGRELSLLVVIPR